MIRLDPAADIEFQVHDSEGRPVRGARIETDWGYFSCVREAACGADVRPTQWQIPPAIRDLGRTTTDASGRAHLVSFRTVRDLKVTAPGLGTQVIRMPEAQERSLKRTITLLPVGRIEGRLIADDPRFVRGLKIWVRTWEQSEGSISARWSGIEGTEIVSVDADGRFSIPAIARGTLAARVLDGQAHPRLPRIPQSIEVTQGKTADVQIHLEPTVLVEGLVQTKETHRPVAGVRVTLRADECDHVIDVTSDAQGRYQARVLPGWVSMSSMLPDDFSAHYLVIEWPFEVPRVRVKPTANGQPFQLPATVLIPTTPVKGTVVDTEGRPVFGATARGNSGKRRFFGATNVRGEFQIQIPEGIKLDSYDVSVRDRLVTDVNIEHGDPLVLKVKSISATGGYEFARRKAH